MDKIKSAPKAIATKVEEMFEDVKSASKAVATEAAKKVENGKKKAEEIKSNIPMPGGDNDTEKGRCSSSLPGYAFPKRVLTGIVKIKQVLQATVIACGLIIFLISSRLRVLFAERCCLVERVAHVMNGDRTIVFEWEWTGKFAV